MTASRFVVGIDLGTTNCALAYVDTGVPEEEQRPVDLMIPQVVQPGSVEPRPLLPSYLYLPGPNELPAGTLQLPWDKNRDYAVGEFARQQGSQVPTRLVNSAKSWLCHPGVDRNGPILPWKAPEGARRVSPVQASTLYLRHLAEVWNQQMTGDRVENRLEQQDIVLTVPASFDAVARELTVESARAAGFEHLTLLEEPQAAFYAWIDSTTSGVNWRKQVKVGESVLIADVGGGTTDLTLIAVGEDLGQMVLTRVAVGDHILLGGDNMDLALAHTVARKFGERGIKLDQGQMLMLWHSCRAAKEKLFVEPDLESTPVTVLGRGSKVIAGTIKGELLREEVERVLVEGFFPHCPADAQPTRQRTGGLQELGLPYAGDPAISRHLAFFLTRQTAAQGKQGGSGGTIPPHPPALRRRSSSTVGSSRPLPCAIAWSRSSTSGAQGGISGGRSPPQGPPRARSMSCTIPTWTGRWRAGRPTTAWCGAARECASGAAPPGSTTSASKRPYQPFPALARRSKPCALLPSAWRKARRSICPIRSLAWWWASRPSFASSARPLAGPIQWERWWRSGKRESRS